MNELLALISGVTRLACIGFVVIAGLTIPEAWKLINEKTSTAKGTTVFVPIGTTCFSSLDGGVLDNCNSLKYFINACVASMFFAGVAILLFIVFDVISRYCKGPISRSSVVGMSLFLSFILIQTAACSFALYNECKYWETFYEDQWDTLYKDQFAEFQEFSDVDEVRTYANKFFLLLTSIMALASAGLLVLDSILSFCCAGNETPKRSKTQDAEDAQANTSTVNTSVAADNNDSIENDVAANDSSEEATTVTDPKRWTSY